MTPRPPARETAEARGAVEVWAMPARRMGWVMWRRVQRGVWRVGRGVVAMMRGWEMGELDEWVGDGGDSDDVERDEVEVEVERESVGIDWTERMMRGNMLSCAWR